MAIKLLEKEHTKVGMRVQDGWGNVGTIRWLGRIEKTAKPPNNDAGTYAAVEFDRAHGGWHRCDGMLSGIRYCTSPAGTVEFHKPKDALYPEMNGSGIAALRHKFGARIAHLHDEILIKFLIARKFELAKVFEMLENDLTWRAEFKPDADEYFPSEMANGYPIGFGAGTDKEGNLLYFERPGNGGHVHPKDFVKQWGVARIARWHAATMEEGRRRQLDSNYAHRRVTMVIDLSHLGDSDRGVLDFAKAIGKIDQDHYPEHLCKMYIINAPGVFSGIWRIIRVFLDDRTKAKISVVGADFKPLLLQQIEEKYLPSFAGGTDDSWLHRGGTMGGADPSRVGTSTVGIVTTSEAEASGAHA